MQDNSRARKLAASWFMMSTKAKENCMRLIEKTASRELAIEAERDRRARTRGKEQV